MTIPDELVIDGESVDEAIHRIKSRSGQRVYCENCGSQLSFSALSHRIGTQVERGFWLPKSRSMNVFYIKCDDCSREYIIESSGFGEWKKYIGTYLD